jgi:uncharacterized protein (DUF427 family)
MDAWFEEDEQVFGNARDPYKRIDVLASSRHVRVVMDGEVIAETRRPRLVLETGTPQRFYIPPEDVRMDRLVPTETKTYCPYKGEASYWSAKANGGMRQDVVWSYLTPRPECAPIAGHLCFYDDRVGAIFVDGEPLVSAGAE